MGAFGAYFSPLRFKEGCREQPQPGVALCLFRTAGLAAYYCWASQAPTIRQQSHLRSQMKLREKALWADGCSETPTNGAGYLRYTPRAALLFCMCFCMGVCVPVWDVCTHVMREPVRGQRSTLGVVASGVATLYFETMPLSGT